MKYEKEYEYKYEYGNEIWKWWDMKMMKYIWKVYELLLKIRCWIEYWVSYIACMHQELVEGRLYEFLLLGTYTLKETI